jgi:hypothetical protein
MSNAERGGRGDGGAESLRMALELMDIIEHAGRIRRKDLIAQLELAGREVRRVEDALRLLIEGDDGDCDNGDDDDGKPLVRDNGEWLEWIG